MKNPLIGIVLHSLLDLYDSGACDSMSLEDQENLLAQISELKDKMEDKLDKVLTIEETANYLHCSRTTVNNLIKEGKLTFKKLYGGAMLITLKDLKKFVRQNKQ